MGKGGKQASAPSRQTVEQTNIPEYARPYVERILGKTEALTDINQNPYQPYGGQRIADFNSTQRGAFENAMNQTPASQLGMATDLSSQAGYGGLAAANQSRGLQNQALDYGQAGQMYGDVGQMYGAQGAQQAQQAAQNAQLQAQRFGQQAVRAGQQSLGYGAQGAGYGAGAANLGLSSADMARQQGLGYGAQGARYGEASTDVGRSAANLAAQQGLGYGAAGAGFGSAAAGLAPTAQQFGQEAADIGMGGLGYGAMGAGFGGRGAMAAEQGFGAGDRFSRQATDPGATQAYMSPYMQNVVDFQKSEALRDFQKQGVGRNAQAVAAGAFGGSRQAIVDAEAQRNLNTQFQGITATGTQKAFEDAQRQQQFGANLGIQGLQAGYGGLGLGMQGAGVGLSGLGTALQGQQGRMAGLGQAGQFLGQGMQGAQTGLQGLQGALAGSSQALQGYQAGMQGAQTGLQGLQGALAGSAQGLQGFQTGLQGSQAGMQGVQGALQGFNTGLSGVGQQIGAGQLGLQGTAQGIQGAQAGMQGAQAGLQGVSGAIGAGQFGLQGLGQAGQAAGQLGQIGQTQFSQEQNINAEKQKIGAIQQGQAQQGLDVAYQDFLKQRNYPYQQMAFQSDMLRGLPLSQSSGQMYNAPPNTASQLGGLGMSALGVYGMSGGFKGANGGIVGYARGGKIGYNTGGDITMMSTEQLTKLLDNPSLTPLEVDSVEKELMMRQRMESNPQAGEIMSGIAAIPTGQMVPEEGMAGGGIVAFADGDLVSETGLNILPSDVKNSTTPDNARAYEDFLLADIMRRQKKMEESDPFAASKAREEKIEAQLAKSQESAPYRALTLAGLRTMGGQSQYGLSNLAGGAEAGLGAYEASRKEVDDANKLLLGQAGEREKSQFARESALLGSQQTTLGALQSRREASERLAADTKEKNRIFEEKFRLDNETRTSNNARDNETRKLLKSLAPQVDPNDKKLQNVFQAINQDDQIPALIKMRDMYDPGDEDYKKFTAQINAIKKAYFDQAGITRPFIAPPDINFGPKPDKTNLFQDVGKTISNVFSGDKTPPAKAGTLKFDNKGNRIED